MAMTEHREGQPKPVDLSDDFQNLDESAFFDRLDKSKGPELILRIPIGLLGADTFQNRLKRFLVNTQGQTRRATIIANKRDYETFGERFTKAFQGVTWEIE